MFSKCLVLYSVIEDEYNSAVSDFDLDEFLTKRTILMNGFEQLPPSYVKSLEFKTSTAMTSSDFKLLLQYYNSVYNYARYIGCTSGLSADHFAMLGYIQVDNSIAKFVSFEMLQNAYKSTESSIKNSLGSFVLAFLSKNGSLSPAQI
jgi:hypothetical protein